jgi:hypothetical protein
MNLPDLSKAFRALIFVSILIFLAGLIWLICRGGPLL